MYNSEKVYRSVIYFVAQIVPSGVEAIEGESYGVRFDDPTGKQPSIAVDIEESRDQPIELGSFSTRYHVVFTISALSRMQRDALKYIIMSGLNQYQIPIYSDFDSFVPSSGSTVIRYAEIGDYFSVRDMPNFDSQRERFYWVAVAFATLDVIGL